MKVIVKNLDIAKVIQAFPHIPAPVSDYMGDPFQHNDS